MSETETAETTDAIGRIRAFLSFDAFGRTIVQSEALDAVAELEVAWRAVEQQRDEAVRESERLTGMYYEDALLRETQANLAAAEARAEAAEQALHTIAESHAYDHSVDGPGAEGTTPYEWARNLARAALSPPPPVPEQERNSE